MTSERPYLNKLKTTLKCDDVVELGPLTCILGEEESGKSALGDSIVLALSGRHHTLKNPAKLLKLAKYPDRGIDIELSGSAGRAIWRLPVVDGAAKTPIHDLRSGDGVLAELTEDQRYCIIPTHAVQDLLATSKSPKTLREEFLRRFGTLTSVPTPEALLPDEAKVWNVALAAIRRELGNVPNEDQLAGMTTHFRSAIAKVRNALKAQEGSLAMRRARDAESSAGAELLPALEAELVALREAESAVAEYEKSSTTIKVAQAALADVEVEGAAFEAPTVDLAAVEARVAELRSQRDALLMRVGAASVNVEVYSSELAKGSTKCPYCPNSHVELSVALKTFQTRLEDRKAALVALDKQIGLAEAAMQVASTQLADREKWLRRVEAARERLEAAQLALTKPVTPPTKSSQELSAQIERLKAAAKAKASLLTEQMKVRELHRELDLLKSMETEATKLQAAVMGAIAERASSEVSACMTNGRKATFDPETCIWSVSDPTGEMREWGTICGTQETALMLGYAAAWTRGSPFRVAVFDDKNLVGLSKRGMKDFFAACEAAYDREDFNQVVVVWNRPEEVPERWTKVMR